MMPVGPSLEGDAWVTEDAVVAFRDALSAASDKVRHPALSLDYFVSTDYLDLLEENDDGSLDGVPDDEVQAARIRRGSAMAAVEQVIDQCIEDLRQVPFDRDGFPVSDRAKESFVYEEFPRRHRRAYNQDFYRKVLVTVIKVAQDLADPQGGEASCTAEEIIISAIGGLATGLCELAELDETEVHLEEALLEDLDFESLFDDDMDGIEDDPARQAAWGLTVPNVVDWFTPFNDHSVVHPYAETRPSKKPLVHNLLRRVGTSEEQRALLDSPAIDAPHEISTLAACSEAVALARSSTAADADPTVWIPDEDNPEHSYSALLSALTESQRGSGWLTWEPHENADLVRTDPVVSVTAHRHFPIGRDEPWLWAAVGGGRLLAIPIAAVVDYRPDSSVRHAWENRFERPES
jgi:hypothetical protein